MNNKRKHRSSATSSFVQFHFLPRRRRTFVVGFVNSTGTLKLHLSRFDKPVKM